MTQSTWSLAGTSSCASAGSTGMALTTAHSADAVPYSIRLPQPASLAPVASIISSSRTTILEWVEKTWMDNLKLPQNLVVYAFSMPLQLSLGQIIEIRDMVQRWVRWNILESLAAYHSVVEMLFGIMKNALVRDSLWISHTIAEEISQCLSRDVYILRQQLVAIFRDPEKYTSFLACRGILAQRLLDLLQDLLDSFPRSSTRSRLSKALVRLSRASGLHPTCFPLTDLQIMGHQVAAGAFGDIFRGLIRGQVVVSVKIMRIFLDAEVRAAARAFGREALIWRQLSHPNLLPFFGLYYLETRLCLVSPWMSNGNVLKFLENVLPPDTVRFSLMLDVAMGLEYLHENQVVHGDLKGMNVLVTPSRRACVADFGLSSIVDAMTLQFTHSTTNASGGTLRYQAPELLSGAMQNHYGSDIYAFACVCYEIWTGKAPFFEFILDAPVIFNVLTGIRPSRPTAIPFDHDLWLLLQDCWKKNSCDRPDASQIVQHLVGPTIGAKPAGAAIDWDETNSAKCRRSLHDWPLLPSVNAIERLIFGDDVVDGE
ncbi:kinase-like domain-containing protein [Mycena galopus ATCC 62051]|nr:kinase-like domain-containing protein [Mycena galopus ATCC 62051]